MHTSIATEQITVQKIPKKLLSKCPPEFGFFSPDAYAVPGVRGTPLPPLPRQCLPWDYATLFFLLCSVFEVD